MGPRALRQQSQWLTLAGEEYSVQRARPQQIHIAMGSLGPHQALPILLHSSQKDVENVTCNELCERLRRDGRPVKPKLRVTASAPQPTPRRPSPHCFLEESTEGRRGRQLSRLSQELELRGVSN